MARTSDLPQASWGVDSSARRRLSHSAHREDGSGMGAGAGGAAVAAATAAPGVGGGAGGALGARGRMGASSSMGMLEMKTFGTGASGNHLGRETGRALGGAGCWYLAVVMLRN